MMWLKHVSGSSTFIFLQNKIGYWAPFSFVFVKPLILYRNELFDIMMQIYLMFDFVVGRLSSSAFVTVYYKFRDQHQKINYITFDGVYPVVYDI